MERANEYEQSRKERCAGESLGGEEAEKGEVRLNFRKECQLGRDIALKICS